MQPLSEVQVAEYRFWRPCGRRRGKCIFGCGEEGDGERSAGRRLFREVESVVGEENEEGMEEQEQDVDQGGVLLQEPVE